MESSELCFQPSVGKSKLTVKHKSKFLSYSKKEKRAHVSKNTTLDNFLVTSPIISEESNSTSCSSHFVMEVNEDKVFIEKEIKSKYFATDSIIDECTKSVALNNRIGNITIESESGVNKTRNTMVSEANILKDDSGLNDSTEFFIEKLRSTDRCHETLCGDKQQRSENVMLFSSETDNNDVFKTQSDCTGVSIAVAQTKRIQCPLCLKSVEKYVTHLKSCAAKRKLTTQQLMMALELQKRQAEERLALGLPLCPEKLPVSRRTGTNKGCPDANLDLALALSVSMKEAEEKEILEEADVLSQAGLKTEAVQKRSTLEGFGFASARPRTGITSGHRARPLMISTLMTRTQEDRERIISEKVALVLISDDASSVNVAEEFLNSEPVVISKKLYKQLNKELRLWKKASVDEDRSSYYVQELCEFVTPTKAGIECNLRHLSQIAGRLNTPRKDDDDDDDDDDILVLSIPSSDRQKQQSPVDTKSHFKTEKQQSPVDTKSHFKTETDLSVLDVTVMKPPSDISHDFNHWLSTSWRSMLGNCIMSDVVVVGKDNVQIPAHKLVIYVRCKQMFSDIVKTDSGHELIVLNRYGQTACIAFLEYLYCSTVDNVSQLNSSEFSELKVLATKYEVSELIRFLQDKKKIMNNGLVIGSCDNNSLVGSAKRRLFGGKKCLSESDNDTGALANQRQDRVMSSDDDIETINSVTADCSSPDSVHDQTTIMVVDSPPTVSRRGSTSDNESPQNIVEENLDMLLSLLQKDDMDTSSSKHEKSLQKDSNPLTVSATNRQDRLESSAEHVKQKHNLSDRRNIVGSDDSDYVIDSSDGDGDSDEDEDEEEDDDDDDDDNNDSGEDDVTQKLSYENEDYNLTQNPDDKNEQCGLTQKLNDGEKNYYDLTQNSDDETDKSNLTQKLNTEKNELNSAKEINNSDDDVMILSSDSETYERSNEGYLDKDQVNKNKEYLSPLKVEKPDCVTVNDFKNSSFDNKSEPTSNIANRESISVSYQIDKKDFIDPVWDGFEDLNCNINDVWQSDSPGTHQKSNDTTTGKASSVKSMSEKDTHSNNLDLEAMSPNTVTPIKTLLDDVETTSPKFNLFGKKSAESVKSLTFESFFKNKCMRQEISMDNIEITEKPLQSSFESISQDKNVNILSLGNVRQLSSLEFETLNSNNSSTDTQLLESGLEKTENYNETSHDSVLLPKHSNNSRESSKLDSKVCSQSAVSITGTNHFQQDNSNKTCSTSGIHRMSESSKSSDCDDNENHDSATVLSKPHLASSISDAHKMQESGSQRCSIDRMKALLDDSFEISDTILLNAEEEAKLSKVSQKLSEPRTPNQVKSVKSLKSRQTVTPDKIRQISKATTPPNIENLMPSANVAGTASTPFSQIIVSDKVTPKPNYNSMDTPLLKKELQRFGLKQSLGRNKSVLLLQYIYDQTHPFVPVHRSQQMNDSVQEENPNSKSSSQQPKLKGVESTVTETDDESDSMSYSSESVLSGDNAVDGEIYCSESCSDDVVEDENTQSTADSTVTAAKLIRISCEKLDEVMKQMIINDSELYSRLLIYEPVSLLEFIYKLETLGYRAKGSDVRRYLDSECIIYQLPKQQKTHMHSRKRRRSVCGSESNRTSCSNKSSLVKTKRVKSNETKETENDCNE